MTLVEAINLLEIYNQWRKGDEYIQQPNPKDISIALDIVIKEIRKKNMRIVFLTGAGVSQESGIPTYRDTEGIWSKYDPEEVCSLEGFEKNPEKCMEFFNEAREGILGCEPNIAHQLIAELEKNHTVTVITQNVDNLHERAGSTDVIHVHGQIFFDRYPDGKKFYNDKSIKDPAIRPDIVMFGENVKHFKEAQREVEKADVIVIIGTSLLVYPFNELIYAIKGNAKRIIIDLELEIPSFEIVKEKATVGMQKVIDLYTEEGGIIGESFIIK